MYERIARMQPKQIRDTNRPLCTKKSKIISNCEAVDTKYDKLIVQTKAKTNHLVQQSSYSIAIVVRGQVQELVQACPPHCRHHHPTSILVNLPGTR
jgi:hypothetical protein